MPESVFRELLALIALLRSGKGCPWDRQQTMADIARYLEEEAREVKEAVAGGDPQAIAEELGDLLFNAVHLARIAEEEGSFDMRRVLEVARDKIVRRHPHVFGDAKAETTEDVLAHWNRVKAEEKRRRNS
jgi:MazG family protein